MGKKIPGLLQRPLGTLIANICPFPWKTYSCPSLTYQVECPSTIGLHCQGYGHKVLKQDLFYGLQLGKPCILNCAWLGDFNHFSFNFGISEVLDLYWNLSLLTFSNVGVSMSPVDGYSPIWTCVYSRDIWSVRCWHKAQHLPVGAATWHVAYESSIFWIPRLFHLHDNMDCLPHV